MNMENINDAKISSPMEGISNLSIEQITRCINNYLETRLDTLITGYTERLGRYDMGSKRK